MFRFECLSVRARSKYLRERRIYPELDSGSGAQARSRQICYFYEKKKSKSVKVHKFESGIGRGRSACQWQDVEAARLNRDLRLEVPSILWADDTVRVRVIFSD